ncbi:beta-lactamase/transpeptidase-like protein [Hyaloscypha variabilis F]|uniref:Beta-lactamase/transpeptidase-like protein n=1 Tax=Hyaloscypha variabilis (strain UAMH 11265 / GT02V1 / F) TaxID=1149755 RepID=A0A2J6S416_HYAVF|nr:beta-lactamase/transpeptidase-like protein [Hyaloscypha variabilis F]
MSAPDPDANTSDSLQGFSKEGLAQLTTQFHKLVDDGKLANIVILVARHGQVVHRDAYGLQNISAAVPVPVKPTTIYRIASMLKPFIGAAMMLLWEEGLWKLDDPVSKFIPSFAALKVKVEKEDGTFELVDQESPMLMKQLMSHTAGFRGRTEYDGVGLRDGDLQHIIDVLSTLPLAFQPGKKWVYGPSVDIQGYIIEKLTGHPLDDFLSSRLFTPLGMVDTGFVLPDSKVERLVNTHQDDGTGKLVSIPLEGTYNRTRPKFIGGGKAILSTVDDYFRFSQMLLNGGEFEGKRYLKPSTIELMRTSVLEPGVCVKIGEHTLPGLGFGMDVSIVQSQAEKMGFQKVGSYFWMGLYGTWFWVDPANDVVVVGFVNELDWWKRLPGAKEICAREVYKALKV